MNNNNNTTTVQHQRRRRQQQQGQRPVTPITMYTISLSYYTLFVILGFVSIIKNIEFMKHHSLNLGRGDYDYYYQDMPSSKSNNNINNIVATKQQQQQQLLNTGTTTTAATTSTTTAISSTSTIRQIIEDLGGGPQASCGGQKCFFPSLSQKQTGWLLANQKTFKKRNTVTSNGTVFDGMMYAYNLTMHVQQQQQQQQKKSNNTNFRHFYLPDYPPVLFDKLSTEDVELLRYRLEEIKSTSKSLSSSSKSIPMEKTFVVSSTKRIIIAQRVQIAPTSGRLYKDWVDDHLVDKMTASTTSSFATNFHNDWFTMIDLIVKKNPELLFDFQFMVDDKTGHIYQLDLDRGYQFITSDITNKPKYLLKKQKEIIKEFNILTNCSL